MKLAPLYSFHITFTKSVSNCVALSLEQRMVLMGEREEIMESISEKQANIEFTQERIFVLLTRCIADVQKTVAESGLKMQDIESEPKNSRQAWIISSIV